MKTRVRAAVEVMFQRRASGSHSGSTVNKSPNRVSTRAVLDKAFTKAEVGNAIEALAEAQRQPTAIPNDVLLNVEYAPSVSAAIALREGKPGEAVALFQAAVPHEMRDPTFLIYCARPIWRCSKAPKPRPSSRSSRTPPSLPTRPRL